MTRAKAQEMFLLNKIQARNNGITSRLTAYLMYRLEKEAGEILEKGRNYKFKKKKV